MSMLKREGIVDSWTDNEILAGDKISSEIINRLDNSDLFICLVSADYLASNYCFEKEFKRALELSDAQRIRIIAIIVEPCDWLSSEFSRYLCLPKDGKAIAEWANENVAYLDIINNLRRVIESEVLLPVADTRSSIGPLENERAGMRRLRVKQEFDAIQRREFIDQSFSVIREYFRNSCSEINDIGNIRALFEIIDDFSFTCIIVNRGMLAQNGQGNITIRNNKGGFSFGDISYSYEYHARQGTANGFVRLDNDDYNMYLVLDQFEGRGSKLDALQVAKALWIKFSNQAGIEFIDE